MKNAKKLWTVELVLLCLVASAAYFHSVVYMEWNVAWYCVCLALFFILYAAQFFILGIVKEKKGKSLWLPAVLGGIGMVGGISGISFLVNNVLLGSGGARFASVLSALIEFGAAVYVVVRLTVLTKPKRKWLTAVGAVLSVVIFALSFFATAYVGFIAPEKSMDELLEKTERELAATEGKLYGTDALEKADGTLTVAFIGGSLTQGRITYKNGRPHSSNAWTDDVLSFLAEKYPQKKLYAVNAGKGGTTSQYGAERFAHDVEPYAPDLLFIEFSVNDCDGLSNEKDAFGTADSQKYLEYMIRRCRKMKKEPAIIYVNNPYPVTPDSAKYAKWKEGVDLKGALCDHYGVPSINVYETLYATYEHSGTSLSLIDWLAENKWYNRNPDGSLDVHPNPDGYRKFYSAAVVGALREKWNTVVRQPQPEEIYSKGHTAYLNGTYSYVESTDARLSYSSGWHLYKNGFLLWLNPFVDSLSYDFMEYPHFTAGIAQVKNTSGAYFSYETDADEIGMAIVSSTSGSKATVLCDGAEVGKFSCYTIYFAMDTPAERISLTGEGKRTVTVRVDDATEDAYLFRFGYLIEFRYGENA